MSGTTTTVSERVRSARTCFVIYLVVEGRGEEREGGGEGRITSRGGGRKKQVLQDHVLILIVVVTVTQDTSLRQK